MDNEKNLLKSSEAAKFLGVSQRTVAYWVKVGKIVPDEVRKNNYRDYNYFSEETLQEFAKNFFEVKSAQSAQKVSFQDATSSSEMAMRLENSSQSSQSSQSISSQAANCSENSTFQAANCSENCKQEFKVIVDNKVKSSQSSQNVSSTVANFAEVATQLKKSPSQVVTCSENPPSQVVTCSSEKCKQECEKAIIDKKVGKSSQVVTRCAEVAAQLEKSEGNSSVEVESSQNEENGKKKREIVKAGNYVKPTSLVMANTKLSNFMFDNSKDLTELTALVVSGRNEEEVTVKTQVFLASESDLGLKLSQNISAYDRAVHDGVCSVIANNTNSNSMLVTNRQIYEAMSGKATTSPQALGHITRSMNKLNRTRVYMNYTDHAKSKGMDCDKMIFRGNLLDFQEVEIVFNKNQSIVGYKILTTPILYKYALEVGQVVTVSSTLLNSPHVINTDESIVLKHYLLRRIETMKNSTNNVDSNKILFSTMFNYCNINDDCRKQLQRKREIVLTILQNWKNVKYIKDFNEYKGSNNKILGIDITLYKPQKDCVEIL